MASSKYSNVNALIESLRAIGFEYRIPATTSPVTARKQVGSDDDTKLLRSLSTCPHCGHKGWVGVSFGVRRMGDGRVIPQSWCRECRKAQAGETSGKKAKAHRRA